MTTAEYTTPRWSSAGRDEPSPGVVPRLLRRVVRGPAPRGEAPRPEPPRGRFRPEGARTGAGRPHPRRAVRLRPPRVRPGPARLPGGGRRPLARHDRGGAPPVRRGPAPGLPAT